MEIFVRLSYIRSTNRGDWANHFCFASKRSGNANEISVETATPKTEFDSEKIVKLDVALSAKLVLKADKFCACIVEKIAVAHGLSAILP